MVEKRKKAAKPIALFIGRFQPFHKGHLLALKWIAARTGRIIVVIGSAQSRNEPKNPLSANERLKMMRRELASVGLLAKCSLVPVKDINNDAKWVAHVDAHVPRYDVAYTNNALVKKLMGRAGKTVRCTPFFKRESYNATKIRARMRKGEDWEGRVPKIVRDFLKQVRAEDRLRRI